MRRCSKCCQVKNVVEFSSRSWCKSCQNEYARRWRSAHPERVRVTMATWRQKNPDRRRTLNQAWRVANPAKAAESSRRWSQANADRVLANTVRWQRANPEKVLATKRRRRARQVGANQIEFNPTQLRERLSMFAGCWMCGHEAEEVDHVKPLARGGPHILANLRPACISCNRRKSARWPLDDLLARRHQD